MISKGDIIRLKNPAERGLRFIPHMHIVHSKNGSDKSVAVCTSNPVDAMIKGDNFIEVIKNSKSPFNKLTYIRTDTLFEAKGILIDSRSRIKNHRLHPDKERQFFKKTNRCHIIPINRNDLCSLNPIYVKLT